MIVYFVSKYLYLKRNDKQTTATMSQISKQDSFTSLYDFYSTAIAEAKQLSRREKYFGDKRTRNFYTECNGKKSVSYALGGWKEGLKHVDQDLDALVTSAGAGKPTYQRGYHGAFIDMGTYVSGRPDCWIEETESRDVHASGRIKRICVGSSFMCGVTTAQYRRRGASIMALIDIIESNGYRVELDLIATSAGRGGVHATKIRAKDADDSLNREKLAYALMSADFFRRFVFAIRGVRQERMFSAHGGGNTRNIIHVRDLDGKPFKDSYDITFPNAEDSYWKDYETTAGARESIINELKSIGVTVEQL